MTVIRAFTKEQAAKLAKASERQVSYWATSDVLQPSILYDRERRPIRYLYSFEDVVGLRAIGLLRNVHGLSQQKLRKAGSHLREYADRPWSELAFWVRGKELFFRDPGSELLMSADRRGQVTAKIELDHVAKQVQQDVSAYIQRDPSDIGKIERRRDVQRNQPVLKGTRVPMSSVLSLAEDGYSIEAIVRAYPSLTRADVISVLDASDAPIVA